MARRKVNVKKRIIEAFRDNQKLTWSHLLELASVSKAALSKHLNELIDMGLIKVASQKNGRGRPNTCYILNRKKLHAKFETSLFKQIMKEVKRTN